MMGSSFFSSNEDKKIHKKCRKQMNAVFTLENDFYSINLITNVVFNTVNQNRFHL